MSLFLLGLCIQKSPSIWHHSSAMEKTYLYRWRPQPHPLDGGVGKRGESGTYIPGPEVIKIQIHAQLSGA